MSLCEPWYRRHIWKWEIGQSPNVRLPSGKRKIMVPPSWDYCERCGQVKNVRSGSE